MKTFLFILVIILGFALMFGWFLLSESNRINDLIKAESWDREQSADDLKTIIKAQTAEIRGLKRENQELKTSNQNWQTLTNNSCGSEKGEIRRLKTINLTCITGLEQCILEISKIIK